MLTKKVVHERARQRRRPTKSGQVLSEKLITDTALDLLNRDGHEGLTARRLGLALGADPSSIYRYFRSMSDLDSAIADELTARATANWKATGDWQADLRSWGLGAYAVYLAHPRATVLATPRVSGRNAEMAGADKVLGLFLDAGFPEETALKAYSLFISQLLGYAVFSALRRSLPGERWAADQTTWRTMYGAAPAALYPHLAATAHHMATLPDMDHYPLALELMLNGLKAVLHRANSQRSMAAPS